MTTTYAVVGASRGIGLEYIRQLSSRPNSTVFAVVRSKQGSALLTEFAATVKNVHVIEGEVSDHSSLQRAAKEIGQSTGGKLDWLVHNAARMEKKWLYLGFNDYATMVDLDADFIEAFKVNTLGIAHSIDAFLPLLRAGTAKKIVVVSTAGASYNVIRKAPLSDTLTAYHVTKSSGTMLTVKYAVLLAQEGFTVLSIDPGYVVTESTVPDSNDTEVAKTRIPWLRPAVGSNPVSAADSVAGQLQVADGMTVADSGKFMAYNGAQYGD